MQTVEVLNGGGTHAIALLRTISVSRSVEGPNRNARTEVVMEQQGSKAPEAVKEWFAGGESRGHEFVYPNHNANHQSEPLAQTKNSATSNRK